MDDAKIIELMENRDETSISELSKKYGGLCGKVAQNILGDFTETEECLNDTYLKVWDSIPPAKPSSLSAFTAAIARNFALMRLRRRRAEKRGGNSGELNFDDLDNFVSDKRTVEGELDRRELVEAINEFLRKQPDKKRRLFVLRYWGCMSVTELAEQFCMTQNNVSVTLRRVRESLKVFLHNRGYEI